MARTFNETVPSVTDIFNAAHVGSTVSKLFFEEGWKTYKFDMHDGVFLIKKTVFLVMLHHFLFKTGLWNTPHCVFEDMNEFIDQSNSKYIVYE